MEKFKWPGLLAVLLGSAESMAVDKLDAVLQAAVKQGHVAGIVALAADSEKVLYSGAYGLADVAGSKPMNVNSIFRIASMTKPLTSVAVMQLADAGQVGLTTEAQKYLPAINNKLLLQSVTENQGLFRKPQTQPTVAQLLSHTSGFGYEVWNEVLAQGAVAGLFTGMTEGGNAVLSAPLVFEPGSRWLYSISTDIVGRVVESVSGMDLEGYFQSNILQPLGMADTSFNVAAGKQSRVVTLHGRQADGTLEERPNQPFAPAEVYSGGGGLYSTGPDYVRFMQMILREGELGKRVLSGEGVRTMKQNQIGGLEVTSMETQWPGLSNSFDFFPDSVARFGYGFLINEQPVAGGRGANSLAWGGLYNTYFWIDPENDICGVVLAQVLPFFDGQVVRVLREFEQAVYESR